MKRLSSCLLAALALASCAADNRPVAEPRRETPAVSAQGPAAESPAVEKTPQPDTETGSVRARRAQAKTAAETAENNKKAVEAALSGAMGEKLKLLNDRIASLPACPAGDEGFVCRMGQVELDGQYYCNALRELKDYERCLTARDAMAVLQAAAQNGPSTGK